MLLPSSPCITLEQRLLLRLLGDNRNSVQLLDYCVIIAIVIHHIMNSRATDILTDVEIDVWQSVFLNNITNRGTMSKKINK